MRCDVLENIKGWYIHTGDCDYFGKHSTNTPKTKPWSGLHPWLFSFTLQLINKPVPVNSSGWPSGWKILQKGAALLYLSILVLSFIFQKNIINYIFF